MVGVFFQVREISINVFSTRFSNVRYLAPKPKVFLI